MAWVKICGVTSLADAQCAAAAGADAIGFNFYPRSRRYVAPAAARAIAAELPSGIWRVGVFVDEPRATVESIADAVGLNAVQLHGAEAPAFCRGWKQSVIKAIRVRAAEDVARARSYDVDFILADAYVEGALGGTGSLVDWSLLEGLDRSRLILAGGLTPVNVASAIWRVRPFGVDVASGVEGEPGRKDPEKVKQFVTNAHHA